MWHTLKNHILASYILLNWLARVRNSGLYYKEIVRQGLKMRNMMRRLPNKEQINN